VHVQIVLGPAEVEKDLFEEVLGVVIDGWQFNSLL
jgi:hypothetical protein